MAKYSIVMRLPPVLLQLHCHIFFLEKKICVPHSHSHERNNPKFPLLSFFLETYLNSLFFMCGVLCFVAFSIPCPCTNGTSRQNCRRDKLTGWVRLGGGEVKQINKRRASQANETDALPLHSNPFIISSCLCSVSCSGNPARRSWTIISPQALRILFSRRLALSTPEFLPPNLGL